MGRRGRLGGAIEPLIARIADRWYAEHPVDFDRAASRPELLSEKIYFKLVHDRDPIMRTFADKVAVRDFVRNRIGPEILADAYAIGSSSDEIDWDALPTYFVAKVTHGSGGLIVVSPHADPGMVLPEVSPETRWGTFVVRPEHFDRTRAAALFDDWLSLDFSIINGQEHPEWCYVGVQPRILVEELLDAGSISPPDYKFFMINGTCAFVLVVSNRFSARTRDLMSPDWRWMRARYDRQRGASAPVRPPRYDEMRSIAERLASGVDFVRVDLYAIGDRIVFGELTNFPEAGRARFRPTSFDRAMGRRLTLRVQSRGEGPVPRASGG